MTPAGQLSTAEEYRGLGSRRGPVVAVGLGLVLAFAIMVFASSTAGTRTRTTLVPNDPGRTGHGGTWADVQWNFSGPYGVNAPRAWANAANAGSPGGAGVTI